tara:strand:- start:54 stop:611 length:558 start_codon:yes stop_codon:yes gene_type:complete
MAHFAQIDDNNVVQRVIVVGDEDCKKKEWWDPLGLFTGKKESEAVGIAFCQNLLGDEDGRWLQTSYNARGFTPAFRGNFAGVGMVYMEGVKTMGVASTDIFIEDPKHINPSWHIGIQTALFIPPGPPGWPPEDEERGNLNWYWSEENYNKDPLTAWTLKDPNKEPGWDSDNPPEDCDDCNDTSMV